MKLKILVIAIFVTLAAYTGFWFHVAGGAEAQLDKINANLAEKNINLTYDGHEVGGFPYRIMITLKNPNITKDLDGYQLQWHGDNLLLFAQPWNFSHLIFTSDASIFTLSPKDEDQNTTYIKSTAMRFSTKHNTKAEGRYSLELTNVSVAQEDETFPNIEAKTLALHLRFEDTDKATNNDRLLAPKLFDFATGFEGLSLKSDDEYKMIDELAFVSELRGTHVPALSIEGLEKWRDEGGTLEIGQLNIKSGVVNVMANGSLTLDEELRPLGAISTRISAVQSAGQIIGLFINLDDDASATLTTTLSMLEAFAGGDGIPLSITAQDGALWLGPLRLSEIGAVVTKP